MASCFLPKTSKMRPTSVSHQSKRAVEWKTNEQRSRPIVHPLLSGSIYRRERERGKNLRYKIENERKNKKNGVELTEGTLIYDILKANHLEPIPLPFSLLSEAVDPESRLTTVMNGGRRVDDKIDGFHRHCDNRLASPKLQQPKELSKKRRRKEEAIK